MKIVKPMVVSFTFRPFLLLGEQRLCVTAMLGFSLTEGERRLIVDTALWAAIGESTDGIVDEGLPKPCGEVLVHGKCYAPEGRPVPVSRVGVRVAPPEPDARRTVDRKLTVFGDRVWRPGLLGRSMTDPAPFTEMPLTWDRAFGGEQYPKNPLGRGIAPAEGGDEIPLPNVEGTSSLVSSVSQRPEPAGFGPLEMGWPQRQSRAGTYDALWLEEDFPGYARDTDPAFFNTAAAEQRIVGFFRGDEEYTLENLHPTRRVIRGTLPGVTARVLLRRKGSRDVEDVSMKVDTLVFLPAKEIGILVLRGTTIVQDDDAVEIEHALAACEERDQPRPVEHYVRALDRRLDKDQSPKLALFEDDLVPPFAVGANLAAARLPQDAVGATTAERERVLAETRRRVVAAAVTAPEVEKALSAPAPGAPSPAAQAKQEAPAPAPTDGPPSRVGKGPPKLKAPELLETMRIASIEPDADIERRLADLRRADEEALRSYKANAHTRDPAPVLDPAELARARQVMRALRSRGETFAGLDWTRHDLSAYNLERADFRGTLLEGADFTGTNLTGTEMSGAVLAHATLRDSRFDGATLVGANLGATVVEGASFAAADMRNAIFARARLRSASLRGANLVGVDWRDAELGAVDFEGASIGEVTFLPGHDLTRCRFARAKAPRTTFLSTKLDGVDFSQAELFTLGFIRVSADRADFRGASMQKFCALDGCSLEGATFEGADLTGAVMLGANLRGANLEGARLEGANLGGSDLTGAKLTGAQARELNMARCNLTDASLRGANLMEAMLQKATLHGTDLSKANLFLANLSRARLSTGTRVTGANLKRALMVPRARREP